MYSDTTVLDLIVLLSMYNSDLNAPPSKKRKEIHLLNNWFLRKNVLVTFVRWMVRVRGKKLINQTEIDCDTMPNMRFYALLSKTEISQLEQRELLKLLHAQNIVECF